MTGSVQIQHAQDSADFTEISLECYNALRHESAMKKVAVCCRVLQCAAVCGDVVWCGAVWCSV